METAIPLMTDASSFAFLDYIKNSFPISFIGIFLFIVTVAVNYLINIKYFRHLDDQIKNFK